MATLLDPIRNLAKVTLSTGYDAAAVSVVLSGGDGAKLPAPATDGAFNLVWWNVTDYPDPSDDPNVEIVRVTARSTDTLTITRAQEGTAASSKNTVGKTYKMILAFTKKQHDDFNNRKESFYPRQEFLPSIFNGVFNTSGQLQTFQSGHGWTQGASGTQSDDTVDFIRGSQSLKMVTPGGNQVCQSSKTNITPTIDFTDKQIVIQAKITGMTEAAEFSLYLSSDNIVNDYAFVDVGNVASGQSDLYFKNGQWITICLRLGNFTTVGNFNPKAINSMRLRYRDDGTGAITVNTNFIGFVPLPTEGVVSITFDDGYDSQYTEARKKLDQYGYAAGAYIIPSVVDTAGQMTLAQIKQLYFLNGWDICTQGDDVNLTTRTAAEIEDDFLRAKQYLRENGFERSADHYAYPNGAFEYGTILDLVRKYWTTTRTILVGDSYSNAYANALPPEDPHKLRAMDVRNNTNLSDVQNAIQRAKDRREWLILNFHRVRDPASEIIDVTPTFFGSVVDYLNTSGVRVMPVSQVIRSISKLYYF